MTTSELRALAEKARDDLAADPRAYTGNVMNFLEVVADPASILALLDDLDEARAKALDQHAKAAMWEQSAKGWNDKYLDAAMGRDALKDANAAMVAALRQAAWHMGTDPDRNALVQAGHGWKTTSVEAADMIRAALALAEKQP